MRIKNKLISPPEAKERSPIIEWGRSRLSQLIGRFKASLALVVRGRALRSGEESGVPAKLARTSAESPSPAAGKSTTDSVLIVSNGLRLIGTELTIEILKLRFGG